MKYCERVITMKPKKILCHCGYNTHCEEKVSFTEQSIEPKTSLMLLMHTVGINPVNKSPLTPLCKKGGNKSLRSFALTPFAKGRRIGVYKKAIPLLIALLFSFNMLFTPFAQANGQADRNKTPLNPNVATNITHLQMLNNFKIHLETVEEFLKNPAVTLPTETVSANDTASKKREIMLLKVFNAHTAANDIFGDKNFAAYIKNKYPDLLDRFKEANTAFIPWAAIFTKKQTVRTKIRNEHFEEVTEKSAETVTSIFAGAIQLDTNSITAQVMPANIYPYPVKPERGYYNPPANGKRTDEKNKSVAVVVAAVGINVHQDGVVLTAEVRKAALQKNADSIKTQFDEIAKKWDEFSEKKPEFLTMSDDELFTYKKDIEKLKKQFNKIKKEIKKLTEYAYENKIQVPEIITELKTDIEKKLRSVYNRLYKTKNPMLMPANKTEVMVIDHNKPKKPKNPLINTGRIISQNENYVLKQAKDALTIFREIIENGDIDIKKALKAHEKLGKAITSAGNYAKQENLIKFVKKLAKANAEFSKNTPQSSLDFWSKLISGKITNEEFIEGCQHAVDTIEKNIKPLEESISKARKKITPKLNKIKAKAKKPKKTNLKKTISKTVKNLKKGAVKTLKKTGKKIAGKFAGKLAQMTAGKILGYASGGIFTVIDIYQQYKEIKEATPSGKIGKVIDEIEQYHAMHPKRVNYLSGIYPGDESNMSYIGRQALKQAREKVKNYDPDYGRKPLIEFFEETQTYVYAFGIDKDNYDKLTKYLSPQEIRKKFENAVSGYKKDYEKARLEIVSSTGNTVIDFVNLPVKKSDFTKKEIEIAKPNIYESEILHNPALEDNKKLMRVYQKYPPVYLEKKFGETMKKFANLPDEHQQ